ncbi:hypothetical protein DL93DRAFT_2225281 [Clavulina sp. PMI_390]|nr:hypothetical protein DL93DRAFT_2225281 [Clavulina sp. PMI_390]
MDVSYGRVLQPGNAWTSFDQLRYLFIFGASNCAVYKAYPEDESGSLVATEEDPLGIEWPGEGWSEPGLPTWSAHLVSSTQAKNKKPPLLVYNYAVGGSEVDDIIFQIEKQFLPHVGSKPVEAAWNAENSLFVFWAGGNDCAFISQDQIPERITSLIASVHQIHEAGGRNFLFLNVPPNDRAPILVGDADRAAAHAVKYTMWNATLEQSLSPGGRNNTDEDTPSASTFADGHPEATIFLFSIHSLFSQILDDPESFTPIINPSPDSVLFPSPYRFPIPSLDTSNPPLLHFGETNNDDSDSDTEPTWDTSPDASSKLPWVPASVRKDFAFKKEDVAKEMGTIWWDDLHPSSAVHAVIAFEIEKFLRNPTSV